MFAGGPFFVKILFPRGPYSSIMRPTSLAADKYALGQYFTRSDVADLICGFCVKDARQVILDPSCGDGIFLLRAFHRLAFLAGGRSRQQIIDQIWGVEIADTPIQQAIKKCQTVIGYNQAPHILKADFFDCTPDIDQELLPPVDAVIGNPPYTRQEELEGGAYGEGYKEKIGAVVEHEAGVTLSARAGIYAYFLIHATSFLRAKSAGRIGFIMLRSWLDVGFGVVLKQYILDHYKIVAIVQSLTEKWFEDAQMIPCIIILEREPDADSRQQHFANFVQVKHGLAEIFPATEVANWDQIEQFVNYIEGVPLNDVPDGEMHIEFAGMSIRDSNAFRVVAILQKDLSASAKWGIYLNAPTAYFKLFSDQTASSCIVPLGQVVAHITAGLKSGANKFFYFPNANYFIAEFTLTHLVVEERRGSHHQYVVEREYVSPILVKFKAQRSIYIQENDGYCLTVPFSKEQLAAAGASVLAYIEYGEQYPETNPYAGRSTCRHRVSHDPPREWFNIPYLPAASLLHFEVATNREATFLLGAEIVDRYLQKHFMGNYGFYNLVPSDPEDTEVLLAILNSTFGYLVLEFGGRYIENRDGTISNETRVGDLQALPIINPAIIQGDLRERVISVIQTLGSREVRKIWEEFAEGDRRDLDHMLFSEVLGLTQEEIEEIYATLSAITLQRNAKKR